MSSKRDATYLEQQGVLDESLHGFQQESIKSVEINRHWVVHGSNLVKNQVGELSSLSLVGNKGLVDKERLLIRDERRSPLLA